MQRLDDLEHPYHPWQDHPHMTAVTQRQVADDSVRWRLVCVRCRRTSGWHPTLGEAVARHTAHGNEGMDLFWAALRREEAAAKAHRARRHRIAPLASGSVAS